VDTAPQISFVLPCYNEGTRIGSSLATLDSWFTGISEILVVDDGSVDDTLQHADRYAAVHGGVRVHRTPHRGKGAAIRTAIPLVRGTVVVIIDADLAFDRESVRRVISALADAEMVIGNRRHHDSYYSVPVRLFGFLYRRHLVGLAFNSCVRGLLQEGVRDTQCGLKAFRRACLDRIAPALSVDGFAIDVEMLVVARALKIRMAEVPVQVRYETAKSSVKLILTALSMAAELLSITLRRVLGRYAPARLRRLAGASSGASTQV
jgi:glycosyltransferase involved in cell wall biosynthesis